MENGLELLMFLIRTLTECFIIEAEVGYVKTKKIYTNEILLEHDMARQCRR